MRNGYHNTTRVWNIIYLASFSLPLFFKDRMNVGGIILCIKAWLHIVIEVLLCLAKVGPSQPHLGGFNSRFRVQDTRGPGPMLNQQDKQQN